MRVRLRYILVYCYAMELWYIGLGHDFYGFMMNLLDLEDIIF